MSRTPGGFEGPLSRTDQRFAALDGWRGVCALMIVFLHAPVVTAFTTSGFVKNGFLFVDFFFVLSGFVISHAFAERLAADGDWKRFMASRFKRVYPLHIFMLALFVAFELLLFVLRGPEAAFQGGNGVIPLVHNVLMTHSLGFVGELGWNYPSWSISAELVAYAIFAALILFSGRWLPLLLAVIAFVSLSVVALRVGHLDTTIGYGWLRCLLGFSLGALLRLVVWPHASRIAAPADRHWWTLAEVATVVLIAFFVARAGKTYLSLAAPFLFAYAIYVFAHEGGAISALLKRQPFVFLGLVSYSIYLTHAFVISRLINVATVVDGRIGVPLMTDLPDGTTVLDKGELWGLAALVVIVAATLVLSFVTFHLVERPGQRLSLGLFRRKRGDGVLAA